MSEPQTAKQLLERMVKGYNPSAYNSDTEVMFQFTGAEKSTYYLKIENGRCTLHQGELSFCKLTLEVDTSTWQSILDGEIPWNIMARNFIIKGNNFALLAKFPQVFGF
jgi:hypothetical protein